MQYLIRVLGDQELPAGHMFAVLEVDSTIAICIKATCMSAPVIAEAWAAARMLRRRRPWEAVAS